MALHHVAQRPGVVVVAPASLDADRLGHRDLNLLHRVGVPQRLEDRIRKAQREQVLHCVLAEVVIDAEHLILGEHRSDDLVGGMCRGHAGADGLLDHDTAVPVDNAARTECRADGPDQRRRRRQVEHHTARPLAERRADRLEPARGLGVDGDIADAPCKARERVLVEQRRVARAQDRLAHADDELGIGPPRMGRADEQESGRQRRVVVKRVERRPKHASREVSGGAKHHECAAVCRGRFSVITVDSRTVR